MRLMKAWSCRQPVQGKPMQQIFCERPDREAHGNEREPGKARLVYEYRNRQRYYHEVGEVQNALSYAARRASTILRHLLLRNQAQCH